MGSKEDSLKCSLVPLVVDVDGSVVCGNLFLEGLANLLVTSPHKLFLLPFWLLNGRAALKRRVADAIPLEPSTLILNAAVTDLIAATKAEGRAIYLASAADERYVAPLAEHLEADGFLASDGDENLAGKAKAKKLIARFGERGFDYIGDEWRDLAVWQSARHSIAVNASPALARRICAIDPGAQFLPRTGGSFGDYLKALRPHQWIKNVLIFAPLVAAHITDAQAFGLAFAAFLAFSACASGTYVLNDILDLPYDRQHDTKRERPLASGRVPLGGALGLAFILILGGLAVAATVSANFLGLVAAYLIISGAYSLHLKHKTFIDVVALAFLYTIRVLAGGAAASVPISPWFLAFSIFFFLALAIMKRQRELVGLRRSGKETSSGRAYFVEDQPVLAALAGASSFGSVVVLALYINGPEIAEHYDRPELLWLLCPLAIYWLGRMVVLANRGVVDDDPVAFALRDSTSWLVLVSAVAIFAGSL